MPNTNFNDLDPADLEAVLGGAGCCYPGSPCCKPGAACCPPTEGATGAAAKLSPAAVLASMTTKLATR